MGNLDTHTPSATPTTATSDLNSTNKVVDLRDGVRVLRSWGQPSGTAAKVYKSRDLDQLRETVTSSTGRGLIPRGHGHSLGDAARCGGGSVVTLERSLVHPAVTGLNWETQRATIRLGATIAQINEELLVRGWFIPTGSTTSQSTFASALSTNALGPSGTSDGHAHSSVQSLVVMTSDGEVVTWARQDQRAQDDSIHTNVSNSRSARTHTGFEAFVGGLGLVGIGLSAEVVIEPVTTSWMVVESVRSTSLAETLQLLEMASTSSPYATALIDPSATGLKTGRGLVRSARHAEIEDLPDNRQSEALKYDERIPSPPRPVSSRLLDPRIAHRVHKLRYYTWPTTPIVDLQPIAEFFHLDDVTGKYPSLIGPLGMVRYAFSIPQASGPHIASVLNAIRETGSTFGRVSINQTNSVSPTMLGYSRPCLSVTIDIAHPVPALTEVLNRCDIELMELGGQITLDSDSRLSPTAVPDMFEDLGQWREFKAQVDPHSRWASDLSRRLSL